MIHDIGPDLIALLPRLRRFALSLARTRDRADDLVQIACEKALANAGSWTPGTRFDAWMFRILRNSWIDTLRRAKTEGYPVNIDDAPDIPGTGGEADAEARLTLQKVWQSIGRLPEEQREVMLLVCIEDFTYAEAAATLGIPPGTVMSRLARAREKISVEAGIERGARR